MYLVLWFDVEEGYNTTDELGRNLDAQLWFDVETMTKKRKDEAKKFPRQ